MEKPGLVDLLLLPLKWLERSRGWKRRGLSFLYLVIFTVVCVLGWHELHLWRLPNIGEPFDEAKYGTVTVAEADNAIPLYEKAAGLLKPESVEIKRLISKYNFDVWASADPAVKRAVEEAGPAFEVWLEASNRSDALFIQPNQMKIETYFPFIGKLRRLTRLAQAEAARRRETGDLNGAWTYYRSLLRTSRLVGLHGNSQSRFLGNAFLRASVTGITLWTDDPATTSEMLKRAIADVEVCQAMTPPNSEMIRTEYFAEKNALSHTENWTRYGIDRAEDEQYWYLHLPGGRTVERFLLREPERSQRVHRLITAGILAQCDRPRWARPKVFSAPLAHLSSIYEIDEKTPRAVASISPASLQDWAERSAYSRLAEPIISFFLRLDGEAGIFDTLRLRMAERAYQLDHGQPPRTYSDLLGDYLKRLPDGIESIDPLNATPVEK